VAGGSTFADAHDGGGHHGRGGERHGGDRGRHDDNDAVLRAALFGSKTTAHGGPTLFNVAPGGIDWTVNRAKAKVRSDGRVEVRIDGLVFAEGPNVGTNAVPQLAATAFCSGAAVGTTKAVPFSLEGDARIDDTLAKAPPSPCLVPAVLINPAAGGTPNTAVYIAASGP
jgi:hypothetical protein